MKFEDIIKNKEYRERVIKYFKLPMRISVSEEKFLSDLDFIKDTDFEKYTQIVSLVEHDFNKEAIEQGVCEPDFTMEHILKPIVENFAANPRWQAFQAHDYSDVLANFEGIKSVHQFYTKDNDGKHFISFDLQAANWQSLQKIIGFEESYEELISKNTDNLIPPISKAIRTKITGLLGARNIMYYNAQLLKDNKEVILESLYKHTKIDLRGQVPFAFYADEFLLEVDEKTKDKLNSMDLNEIEKDVYIETGVKIHLTPFTLKWLSVDKSCAKIYKDNKYEILNISKDVLLIMNKLLCGKEVKLIDYEKINLKEKTEEEFIAELKNALKIIKGEF